MQLRIALLNASHGNSDTPRNFRRELDADLVEFDVSSGSLPDSFRYDAAVVTGSRASVYWDEPWIAPLKRWTRQAIDRDMPFLGVCYGHQLLADVIGGTVEGMDDYELGYRTVTHRGGGLFEGIDTDFTVFTTHSDTVTDLPPEATLTAENDRGIHGFQCGDVFGVQFHPEYDMETAERVTDGKRDQLPDGRIDRVLGGIDEETYDAACGAKTLFENFTAYVRERRAERSEADRTDGNERDGGSEPVGESAGAV
jgi:GMP synthase (glutamine-hydrolysing)